MQRYDQDIIAGLIPAGSRVLDLGCGNGDLLLKLKRGGMTDVRGVEINDRCIAACVRKGLTVFHGDIDEGLSDYDDGSFDYIVLNQTLQVVHKPTLVINEMLRVGNRAIVSFPNFGHFKIRWHLLSKGIIGLRSCETGKTVKYFRNLLSQVGIFVIKSKREI